MLFIITNSLIKSLIPELGLKEAKDESELIYPKSSILFHSSSLVGIVNSFSLFFANRNDFLAIIFPDLITHT